MVINSLTNKSSVGIDGISTILLKCIAPSNLKPLTLIINQVMKTGVFPNKMKLAKVIPIYKKMTKHRLPTIDRYRFCQSCQR